MEPSFTSDWFKENIPIWKDALADLRGKPHVQFLEVGTHEGRSACWLLQNILTHPTSHITCVDLFDLNEEGIECWKALGFPVPKPGATEERFDGNIRALGAQEKVTKFKGASSVFLRSLPLAHFDGAYIDASHRARNVLMDMMLTWDTLKAGAILILDDYEWTCFPGKPLLHPKIAIDAFLTVFAGEYIIIHKGFQVILQKNSTHPQE